ncbi:MAG: MOSC domain-containing protein [Sandarakinorhabdus sp.]|nr:MOSC domain-containing protein [Sandarakinorhabdus sp.]
MIAPGTVLAVHIGRIARLQNAGRGGRGIDTAFVKTPVAGPVAVHSLGLTGDEQGNLRVHGGPEKAVYGYPVSGYADWRADFPDMAARFGPGAMGENLVIEGHDETDICIGDTIRCGTATLQIAQIREPCSTLAAVLGTSRVVRTMTRSGRCGWYYRVLQPGVICAGDSHAVIDRPNPDWSILRFAAFAAGRGGTIEALTELAALAGLTPAWQRKAAAALAQQI